MVRPSHDVALRAAGGCEGVGDRDHGGFVHDHDVVAARLEAPAEGETAERGRDDRVGGGAVRLEAPAGLLERLEQGAGVGGRAGPALRLLRVGVGRGGLQQAPGPFQGTGGVRVRPQDVPGGGVRLRVRPGRRADAQDDAGRVERPASRRRQDEGVHRDVRRGEQEDRFPGLDPLVDRSAEGVRLAGPRRAPEEREGGGEEGGDGRALGVVQRRVGAQLRDERPVRCPGRQEPTLHEGHRGSSGDAGVAAEEPAQRLEDEGRVGGEAGGPDARRDRLVRLDRQAVVILVEEGGDGGSQATGDVELEGRVGLEDGSGGGAEPVGVGGSLVVERLDAADQDAAAPGVAAAFGDLIGNGDADLLRERLGDGHGGGAV